MAIQTPVKTLADIIDSTPPSQSGDNSQRGLDFVPTVDGNIVGLGFRMPGAVTKTVNLWNVTTQALLATVSMSNPGGATWAYTTLGTQVPVTSGQTYAICLAVAGSSYYRFSPYSGFPAAQADINFVGARFGSGTLFPTSVSTSVFYCAADVQFEPGPPPGLGGSWGTLELA